MWSTVVLYICLAILGLVLAYRIPVVKFYAKYTIFCCAISIGALYFMVEFMFRGRDYKNAWRFKEVFRFSGWLIGIKPVLKDEHNLVNRPCIFVSNHQSCIDVTSLTVVWPERCTIIAKASIKYAGPVGLITWFAKLIYLNRSKHDQAVSAMKRAAQEARENQVSVYVFPEGTRSCTGTILPFKKGAFHLAVECQFPIQPVVISPYNRFIDFENKRFDDATYYVQVLPPIETAGMDASNVDALLAETREKMVKCFEELKHSEVI